MMDVEYVEKAEARRSCADCKHYEEEQSTPGIGKCFGREVQAEGGCNLFESK